MGVYWSTSLVHGLKLSDPTLVDDGTGDLIPPNLPEDYMYSNAKDWMGGNEPEDIVVHHKDAHIELLDTGGRYMDIFGAIPVSDIGLSDSEVLEAWAAEHGLEGEFGFFAMNSVG